MIHGLTDQIRYQRAGKIHLGIRVKTDKPCKCGANGNPNKECHLCMGTGLIHRPKEVDYFVLKKAEVPELVETFGEEPKLLNVMLPRAWELDRIFPQWYKLYGRSGVVKCIGDGLTARCVNSKTASIEEVPCFQTLEKDGNPCPHFIKEECVARAILNIRITQHGNSIKVYHIGTGSINSILNINTALRDFIWFSLTNRVDISDIKLILKRERQKTQRVDKGSGKAVRGVHWPMTLDLDPEYYKSWQEVKELCMPIPEKRSNIAIAALPEAKEIAEEDVLDPDGKIKDESEEVEKKEPEAEVVIDAEVESQEDLPACKLELSFLLEKFTKLGGKLTEKEGERLDVLGDDVAKHKDAIKHFKEKVTALDKPETLFKEGEDKEG